MNSEQWSKVKEIFTRVADLPENERADALNSLTSGDAKVRGEIEKLLASDGDAETLFERFIRNPEPDRDDGQNRQLQRFGKNRRRWNGRGLSGAASRPAAESRA